MSTRATAQRFRQRKLSVKQNLPIVRESEVEKAIDDDAQRHIPRIETGVEKGEEIVSTSHFSSSCHVISWHLRACSLSLLTNHSLCYTC
jgi:hypothetical protein